ncbi:MAG: hypothetical protein KKE42_14345 [Alphaproteobacteria bacterium]|uniref:hypothetical protein n=1 Tax=Brevundimonas sp. TaxID=1871086 RepID=UPI0017B4DF5D|nr:hypothetical protein [Brevundimonas sp.]MBA3050187.1 hypothetical protein [Brevundimonas sp.]MBU3969915.1 hypothetical protein [Alphaproteobacteria bacterium]MBU3974968.1 hypothetical protein [Alphaproteobacteria bacterium]MBU4138157.1 hypothetical protein [Alphaproteobacteria bacterium]
MVARQGGRMVRRAIRTDRLIAVLGVAVIALGALVLWFVTHGAGAGFTEEPVSRRVLRQAREQLGPTAEVRLIEPGRGRVVCGYVAAGRTYLGVGFISRPNRMLLGEGPLKAEFRAMIKADCPGFPEPPAGSVVVD